MFNFSTLTLILAIKPPECCIEIFATKSGNSSPSRDERPQLGFAFEPTFPIGIPKSAGPWYLACLSASKTCGLPTFVVIEDESSRSKSGEISLQSSPSSKYL